MSESFVEKLVFLLLTALISGVLVPLIVKLVAARVESSKKRIESARIREQAITSAQARLLEQFSEVSMAYQTLALDVSWFGCPASAIQDLQASEFERYNEQVIDLHTRWRTLLIRARLLTSGETHEQLQALFEQTLLQQDAPPVSLYNQSAGADRWLAQHQTNQQVLARTNDLIARMAQDMKLTRQDLLSG